MSNRFIALAASLFACVPFANAAPGDDAMIAQLKQLATQGQDAQTAAQVNQYIDQNKGAISAILASATSYLKQTVNATDDSALPATPPPAGAQAQGTQTECQNQAQTDSMQGSAIQASTGTQASSGLQPSSGLTTSSVQPSSGLQTSHLAGYPSLPAGDPITSVTTLTAAQTAYAAEVRKENYDRKAVLMNSASDGAN